MNHHFGNDTEPKPAFALRTCLEDRQVGNGYLVSAYCRKLLYFYLVGVGGRACQRTQYYLLSSPGSKTMKQCIAVLFSSEGWHILSIFIVLPSCSMTEATLHLDCNCRGRAGRNMFSVKFCKPYWLGLHSLL